jgi:peptide/nickel transport system ATP-binding protein
LCEKETPAISILENEHQIKCHLDKSKLDKMEPVIKTASELTIN